MTRDTRPPSLLSVADADMALRDMNRATGAQAFAVISHDGSPLCSVGSRLNDGATASITEKLGPSSAQVSVWCSPDHQADPQSRLAEAVETIRSWWRSELRSERVPLFTLEKLRDEIQTRMEAWISAGKQVALIYADIDHFKQVNDTIGHAAGDKVIASLGRAIFSSCPTDGIALHRSGDEFVIAFPTESRPRAIERACDLFENVNAAYRAALDGQVAVETSLSMGLAIDGAATTLLALETRAESALVSAGQKHRNALVPEGWLDVSKPQDSYSFILAASARADRDAPFGSDWLNLLSARVARSSGDETEISTQAATCQALELAASPGAEEVGSAQHAWALGAALAHGLSRCPATEGGVHLKIDQGRIELDWKADGSGQSVKLEAQADEAEPLDATFAHTPHAMFHSQPLLIVQLGETVRPTPALLDVSQAVIYVDDRPATGGGLPDFWEGAIAEIASMLAQYPNVTDLIVLGDQGTGSRTLEILSRVQEWAQPDLLDQLTTKTGLTNATLLAAAKRLNGHWALLESSEAAIRIALKSGLARARLLPEPEHHPDVSYPIRRRPLMEEHQLTAYDGCRVETAYDAFPIALDLIRATPACSLDQLGRAYSEIVDFRISLARPHEHPIPKYYQADRPLMEDYVAREFLQPGGKFHDALNEDKQLPRVLDYLGQIVSSGDGTSRRALLVVPHRPSVDDVAPLGLVSIRVMPRVENGERRLDFSFTWRTVEALVGLPYSLYGSIRYAENIVDWVNARLSVSELAQLGRMSYIAHSFHLYATEYGLKMARLIVNDATA